MFFQVTLYFILSNSWAPLEVCMSSSRVEVFLHGCSSVNGVGLEQSS